MKEKGIVQHLQKIFASCNFCTVRIISQSFQRDVEMRPKRAKLRMSQVENEPTWERAKLKMSQAENEPSWEWANLKAVWNKKVI